MKQTFWMSFFVLFFSINLFAQHEHDAPAPPEEEQQQDPHAGHQMQDMDHGNPVSDFFMRQAAGTALNPESVSMQMSMKRISGWNFMTHGYAFLNVIQQSGPRGKDQVFSTNHLMLIGEKPLNSRSSVLVRGMLSLEPGTMQDGMYPLLFQTGETADGLPIVDGQHPHDLFMELSAQYAIQVNPDMMVHFYGGLRGDPALGPVAFPHRVSAQELPQAALSHHLQDSTHIADVVLTGGVQYRKFRVEFSGFHGAEPDEHRWDLDPGAIDSWSTRFTFDPSENWSGQISTGRLKEPEELEPGDIHRTTASVTHHRVMADGFLASSFVWGWNHKILNDLNVHSYLFETLWQFRDVNYATARFEIVDKEELFGHADDDHELDDLAGQVFNIKAFTVGYARDFELFPKLQTGIGANVTFYATPAALEPFYGESPKGVFVYFRIRSGNHDHN
jgi:hypothetical protein